LAELKRYPVKYIRDKVKSNYPDKVDCTICGATEQLHYHHYTSLAQLYNKWAKDNQVVTDTVEQILEVRDIFIEKYWEELVNMGACLCKKHHEMLHKIFGKDPSLATSGKQERWVGKQRARKYKEE
jgi:hypothetical protein